MDEIDRLISTVRGRNVLRDIRNVENRRMPCGDARIAERLRALGAIRLTNPKKRDMASSWVLTNLGLTKVN